MEGGEAASGTDSLSVKARNFGKQEPSSSSQFAHIRSPTWIRKGTDRVRACVCIGFCERDGGQKHPTTFPRRRFPTLPVGETPEQKRRSRQKSKCNPRRARGDGKRNSGGNNFYASQKASLFSCCTKLQALSPTFLTFCDTRERNFRSLRPLKIPGDAVNFTSPLSAFHPFRGQQPLVEDGRRTGDSLLLHRPSSRAHSAINLLAAGALSLKRANRRRRKGGILAEWDICC